MGWPGSCRFELIIGGVNCDCLHSFLQCVKGVSWFLFKCLPNAGVVLGNPKRVKLLQVHWGFCCDADIVSNFVGLALVLLVGEHIYWALKCTVLIPNGYCWSSFALGPPLLASLTFAL